MRTETPTKLDHPERAKPTRETEEEVPLHAEYESPPKRVAEPVTTRRKILIGDEVEHIIEELKEEHEHPSQL